MALRKLLVAHILGSPLGGAVAVRRLRGQPASASTQPMGGGRWRLALSVLANASPPPPRGEARLGSPFGGAVAVRRLRGQPASASTQPMRGGRWHLALSVLANASPLSPAGSGAVCQWQTSITDRRGSGDQALNGAHWAPAPLPAFFRESWAKNFTRLRRSHPVCTAT